jgi:hypothetical protein
MDKALLDKKMSEDLVFENMYKTIRGLSYLREDSNSDTGKEVKIPKTDPYFTELKNNLTKFVGSVVLDDNSLIVYPEKNDVIFNGAITGLNNLKFQFRYNDQSGGLYIWGDSVLLTKDTVAVLDKLVVIKEQWQTQWDEKLAEFQN